MHFMPKRRLASLKHNLEPGLKVPLGHQGACGEEWELAVVRPARGRDEDG